MKTGKLWDIFCKVIDNYGDIGVCWRLATGLAERGERVRLWVDDPSALQWMAPDAISCIVVMPWTQTIQTESLAPGDILIEAFACEVPPEFIEFYAKSCLKSGQRPVWINLEYLTAEDFAVRNHGLPSPVMSGPGSGLTKHFYYPGFSASTGGLLRESDLKVRLAQFDRSKWLSQYGVEIGHERLISLFCYEPPALLDLLEQLAADDCPTRLLITSGRASIAVQTCIELKNKADPSWNQRGALSFTYIPALSQRDFDHLLWACDLNFVRGEDSLIRALWANKPFVWQIYPQDDEVHHIKLDAFLRMLDAPPSLWEFHHVWNGISKSILPRIELLEWGKTVAQANAIQVKQLDLVTQLMGFATKNH